MDLTLHQDINNKAGGRDCSFPILRSTEILECLNELGIPLSKAELQEPLRHKEKLRQTFLALLQSCYGKAEEDFEAPLSVAFAKEHWSDGLHLANYGEMSLFQDLVVLFQNCFISDFHLRDLLQPSSKRLRDQLSAIINLVKYSEQQVDIFAHLSEPRLAVYKDLEIATQEQDALREEEHALQTQMGQARDEMEAILAECQQLEMEIAQSNKVQLSIRQQADLLKKQATNLKDELDTTRMTLHESAVELDHWKCQVVNSPERKKKAVEEKTQLLEAAQDELNDMEQARSRATDGKQTDRKLLQEFENLQSEDVMLDLASAAEQVASLIRDDQAKVEKAEHLNNLENQELENAERTFKRQEEHLASEQKCQKLKIAATQETFETVTSQLLRLEKERREAMARTEKWDREVRGLEQLMEEEQEKSDQEIRNMISQYKRIEKAYLAQNKRRMADMGIATD